MAAPTLVGSDVQTSTPGLINCPSGISAGTVLFVIQAVTALPPATWPTPPTGFVLQEYGYFGAFSAVLWTYVCLGGGSDPANWSNPASAGDAPAMVFAFDGVDNVTPWISNRATPLSGATADGGTGTTPTSTGFTPPANDSLILWWYCVDYYTALTAGIAGYTPLVDGTITWNAIPTFRTWGLYSEQQTTAAATGAVSGTTAASSDWLVFFGAVNPASGGGGSAALLANQRRPVAEYSFDADRPKRLARAFQAQTAATVLALRRTSEDAAADEYRRAKLARVPATVPAWAALVAQRRMNDDQSDFVQRTAPRFVAATARQPALYLLRRGADELPAEEKRARLASGPASVTPWAALAPIRRTQEEAQAAEATAARHFVNAPAVTAQATALPGQRRALDDTTNEAPHLARAAVFAPVAQVVSAVLAQPKRSAEVLEEERLQRKGFVSAAVAQVVSAILAQPKRSAEALEEERPQRKGFVSAAVAQIASAVLAQPKRNVEVLEEERPQRKGFAIRAVAQVLSAVLAQPKCNVEPIEEEARTIRRTLWSFVTALLQSLGGTVRINEQAQAVSLSAEQIQQVAATAQAQVVTVEGVESMYYVNTRTRMTFTFSDFDGTPTDPTTVSLLIDGTTVTPTRKSAGVWYYDYLPTSPGPKSYVITGTGAIAATRPGKIMVLAD